MSQPLTTKFQMNDKADKAAINSLFDGVAPYDEKKLATREWKFDLVGLGWVAFQLESVTIDDAMRELPGKIERGEYRKCDPALPKMT